MGARSGLCILLNALVAAAVACLHSRPAAAVEQAASWASTVAGFEKSLSNVRRTYDTHRATLAAVAVVADDPAVAQAFAEARQLVSAEGTVVEEGEAALVHARAVGEAIAAGDASDPSGKMAASRAAFDAFVAAGLTAFGEAGKALERLVVVATPARIRWAARKFGGRWVAPGIFFVPGGDRLLPGAARRTLADLTALLETCPGIRLEIAARPGGDGAPGAAKLAAKRATEVWSYLVQNGIPPERVSYAAESSDGPEPEALVPWQSTKSSDGSGEDGRILVSMVTACP